MSNKNICHQSELKYTMSDELITGNCKHMDPQISLCIECNHANRCIILKALLLNTIQKSATDVFENGSGI